SDRVVKFRCMVEGEGRAPQARDRSPRDHLPVQRRKTLRSYPCGARSSHPLPIHQLSAKVLASLRVRAIPTLHPLVSYTLPGAPPGKKEEKKGDSLRATNLRSVSGIFEWRSLL